VDDDESTRRSERSGSSSVSPRSNFCVGAHWVERPLSIYCSRCNEALCETRFIELHNGHEHESVDLAAVRVREQLKDEVDKLANIALQHVKRLSILKVRRLQLCHYFCLYFRFLFSSNTLVLDRFSEKSPKWCLNRTIYTIGHIPPSQ